MSILNDEQIYDRAIHEDMIWPFYPEQVTENGDKEKVISYGLSSYGYDITLAKNFVTYKGADVSPFIIDPKHIDEAVGEQVTAKTFNIPPGGFVLARSREMLKIPRDIMCICVGKSTYARCGIIVNVTPLEPEWKGFLTIEISNTTKQVVKVYAEEGIAQLLFIKADEVCKTSYKDKRGKYQNQKEVTLPIL